MWNFGLRSRLSSRLGSTGITTFSMMSRSITACLMPSACWLETTTVSTRTGLPSSYSMVTCDFPSGRR